MRIYEKIMKKLRRFKCNSNEWELREHSEGIGIYKISNKGNRILKWIFYLYYNGEFYEPTYRYIKDYFWMSLSNYVEIKYMLHHTINIDVELGEDVIEYLKSVAVLNKLNE